MPITIELTAVGEMHAAHDVHLPELHRACALPALVVLGLPPARLGVDEAVPDEAAVDRRVSRSGAHPLAGQAVGDGARARGGVEKAHRRCAPRPRAGAHGGRSRGASTRWRGGWRGRSVRSAAASGARSAASPRSAWRPPSTRWAHDLEKLSLWRCWHYSQLDEHLPALLVDRPCGNLFGETGRRSGLRCVDTGTGATVAEEPGSASHRNRSH